jgi:predicted permease
MHLEVVAVSTLTVSFLTSLLVRRFRRSSKDSVNSVVCVCVEQFGSHWTDFHEI